MDAVVQRGQFETSNCIDEINERNYQLGWDIQYRQLKAREFSGGMAGIDIGESTVLVEAVDSPTEVVGEFDGGVVSILVSFNPSGSGTYVQGQDFCSNAFLLQGSGEINCITAESTQLGEWFVDTDVFHRSWAMLAPGLDPFQFGYYGFVSAPPELTRILHRNNERIVLGDYALSATEGEYISCVLATFAGLALSSAPGFTIHPRLAVRARLVKRARDYIEAHLSDSISLPELCGYTGTSISTLSRVFGEYYGMSPAAFIRWRRMYLCRDTLETAIPAETSVGDVIKACGIRHAGRFAREYHQFFGETPKQTLGYLTA